MEYALETTQIGCVASLEGDLSVEIEHPRLEKGILRGTLTVRRQAAVVHRDTVNLTSEHERKKLLKRLAAVSVEISDCKLLVALDEACRQLIGEEAATSPTEPRPAHLSYQATEQGLIHLKLTREGEVPVPLTNFIASIVGEVVRDDGVEIRRSFELEAYRGDQKHRFDVPASKFHLMGWVTEKLGPSAVLYAGFGTRDHTRAAIQLLSGEIPSRSVYTHLGWREIDGKPCYLHAGGPIGPIGPIPGIEIEPPDQLKGYTLPSPPGGEQLTRSIRASMQMLEILPMSVMVPVYCTIWRAAAAPCDFSVHLSGQTGAGKTEAAALAQRHYGQGMDARHLPCSWSSTGNSLEILAFGAKDALLVVDDFAPEGTSYDVQRLHKEAARVFRAQGNRSGRQRLRPDGTPRPEKHPRGLILSTGEDIPRAHSVRARILTLEVPSDGMDWSLLTECQRAADAGLYAGAFAAYVQWLSRNYAELGDRRRRRISELQGDGARAGHRRTSMIEAELIFGLDLFLAFAAEAGALSADEADRWMDEGIAALRQAASAQAQHLAAVDPVRRFFELLLSALASGTAHLAAPEGEEPEHPNAWGWQRKTIGTGPNAREEWQSQGGCVGWVEDDDLYLNPDAAYRAAEQMTTGESLTVMAKTLWKRMQERGLLASSEPDHNTIRRRLQGRRRRVLHLKVATLMPEESVQSVQSVPEPGNSGSGGPIPWTDSETEREESVPEIGPESPAGREPGPKGPIGPILEGNDSKRERDSFLEL